VVQYRDIQNSHSTRTTGGICRRRRGVRHCQNGGSSISSPEPGSPFHLMLDAKQRPAVGATQI